MEKFDFSKIEDKKKFDNLPEKEREEIVDEAYEEATKAEGKNKLRKDKDYFIECLKKDYTKIYKKLKEGLPEEFVQQATKERFIIKLEKCDYDHANDIKKNFSLPKEFIESSEVQQATKEGISNFFKLSQYHREVYIEQAIKIKNNFLLERSIESISQIIKEGLSVLIKDNMFTLVDKVKNGFSLQEKFVEQVAMKCFSDCLEEDYFYQAVKIRDKFLLSEEYVQQSVKERFVDCLEKDQIEIAIIMKDIFFISDKVLIEYLSNNVVKGYGDFGFERFVKIKNKFNLSEKIAQQIAKEGMIKQLDNCGFYLADKIKNKFNISIHPAEIIEKIPKIKNFVEKIKEISQSYYVHVQKSFELLGDLFEFKNNQDEFFEIMKKDSFLLNIMAENAKFGSKLFLNFSQFDELSQQNIKTLFATKKEILKENPDIDPESLGFRQLMQEKLKNYENNPEILTEMKKNGINIDEWLNYQETRYFSLESGKSNLSFSETVSTPLNRIKETIGSYIYQIKEVLKEYKQELSGCQIPTEDSKEIENKIAQMREEMEKARAEGNDKKTQGIQKGIDGLTQKLANLKTVSSWDKVLGDINAFDQLKNDVFGMQEKLIQAESEFAEKNSGKTLSGKEIQEAKQRIAKAKEELRNKFGLLENRIENFKINLPNLIEPALGKERTEFLIQEIETNLAEQFDHYNTDRSDLANLFSEKSDKEKDNMDSQPMSIFVWARNPDIDLYQGNYSDCCIKINSEHMGAESTIADYNTDLGVQIVNIWDETKNEPVTAAWCWLGKNEKGETSLVVDNIESNTLYSSNYQEQLTKELFDYLKNYTKAIGVKKIVLGKDNNDLPTGSDLAKLSNDDGRYEKIGGYNRADGYFLEAQNQSVKIIWEAKNNVVKEEKSKLETSKIEFKDINTIALSEKYFEAIKRLERKIYRGTDLIRGEAMIQDIKDSNGLDYSVIVYGVNLKTGNKEAVAYAIAIEDETDEGDNSIYLDDIAVLPEAQRQGLGWKIFKELVEKLKDKSAKEGKSVIFDMHLREDSQRLLERHRQDIEEMGVKLIEEALVADYYDEGEDALYQVYEVKGNA